MPIGSGHMLLIVILLIVVLIIWGPGKLPDVGAGMGRAIREFKKASQDTKDAMTSSMKEDTPPSAPPATPVVTTPPTETKPAEEQTVSH